MASRQTERIRLRLLQMRLHRRLRRGPRLRLLLTSLLLTACAGGQEGAAPAAPESHLFANEASGVALQLPPIWAGRYRVADSITAPATGLERELALRFVKADSGVVPEPLLVVRVFTNEGWSVLPADSATARWGTIVARDGVRTVAVKPAGGNPLTPGTADALGFDSLMMAVLQRPMTASLRPPGSR